VHLLELPSLLVDVHHVARDVSFLRERLRDHSLIEEAQYERFQVRLFPEADTNRQSELLQRLGTLHDGLFVLVGLRRRCLLQHLVETWPSHSRSV
jgi:hypothetical protein